MQTALNLSDLRRDAQALLPAMAWEYLDSGAGDELTLARNCAAFDDLEIFPRVLRDVSTLDTSVTLLGETLPHPVLLAPVAYHQLFHPAGERATALGAAASGAIYCVSTMTTVAIAEIAQAAPAATLWFQLYAQRDRGFTKSLLERAQAAGARALVVTVDTPVLGHRVRETRAGFALPAGLERAMLRDLPPELLVSGHGTDLDGIYYPLINPALTWSDIEWIRSISQVPVFLKGILHPDDARLAALSGADGIIVSNHGARNLDTAPATLDVLPEIFEQVAGVIPVIFDGGIRRGTDILKALALGATAVMIGRPYIWGLAAHGAAGVQQCVELLVHELKVTLALCGEPSLENVGPELLRRRR